ncbi:MAG: hypothetical protein JRN20_04840 [Nitrososphaerota archaeon]|nr:hypothetical protein [Nitrososphaerota archaeon]
MNWPGNLRESQIVSRTEGFYRIRNATYDVESLLSQIGDRDAVVDACLPPQLVEDLRRRNINAVWVPAILGDGVSDEEIERQLLISGSLPWQARKKQKVLLTRDVRFSRRLKSRAILVRHRSSNGTMIANEELQKQLRLVCNSDHIEKL